MKLDCILLHVDITKVLVGYTDSDCLPWVFPLFLGVDWRYGLGIGRHSSIHKWSHNELAIRCGCKDGQYYTHFGYAILSIRSCSAFNIVVNFPPLASWCFLCKCFGVDNLESNTVNHIVNNIRGFSNGTAPIEYYLKMVSLLSKILQRWQPSRFLVSLGPDISVKFAVLQLYSALGSYILQLTSHFIHFF